MSRANAPSSSVLGHPDFSHAFAKQAQQHLENGAAETYERLAEEPLAFAPLDVQQLAKHFLAAKTAASSTPRTGLSSLIDHVGWETAMVQCQRTRRFITTSLPDGRTWVCPYCTNGEAYRMSLPNEQSAAAFAGAVNACRAEFGVVDDGIPTLVFMGEYGETVFIAGLGRFHIYLSRDNNPNQTRYQAAHEAFHRVCTPPNAFSWAHEMLAVHFALRFLDHGSVGLRAYAELTRVTLRREANFCSRQQMLALGTPPYPTGLYGRAFVVGEELVAALGWDQLKSLALARGTGGEPGVDAWLTGLSGEEESLARRILGI